MPEASLVSESLTHVESFLERLRTGRFPAFLLSLFGATFLLTWLFNRTNGSVFLPMLFHATVNTIGAGLIFPLFSGAALIILWYIYGVIWLCVGLPMLLFSANNAALGYRIP